MSVTTVPFLTPTTPPMISRDRPQEVFKSQRFVRRISTGVGDIRSPLHFSRPIYTRRCEVPTRLGLSGFSESTSPNTPFLKYSDPFAYYGVKSPQQPLTQDTEHALGKKDPHMLNSLIHNYCTKQASWWTYALKQMTAMYQNSPSYTHTPTRPMLPIEPVDSDEIIVANSERLHVHMSQLTEHLSRVVFSNMNTRAHTHRNTHTHNLDSSLTARESAMGLNYFSRLAHTHEESKLKSPAKTHRDTHTHIHDVYSQTHTHNSHTQSDVWHSVLRQCSQKNGVERFRVLKLIFRVRSLIASVVNTNATKQHRDEVVVVHCELMEVARQLVDCLQKEMCVSQETESNKLSRLHIVKELHDLVKPLCNYLRVVKVASMSNADPTPKIPKIQNLHTTYANGSSPHDGSERSQMNDPLCRNRTQPIVPMSMSHNVPESRDETVNPSLVPVLTPRHYTYYTHNYNNNNNNNNDISVTDDHNIHVSTLNTNISPVLKSKGVRNEHTHKSDDKHTHTQTDVITPKKTEESHTAYQDETETSRADTVTEKEDTIRQLALIVNDIQEIKLRLDPNTHTDVHTHRGTHTATNTSTYTPTDGDVRHTHTNTDNNFVLDTPLSHNNSSCSTKTHSYHKPVLNQKFVDDAINAHEDNLVRGIEACMNTKFEEILERLRQSVTDTQAQYLNEAKKTFEARPNTSRNKLKSKGTISKGGKTRGRGTTSETGQVSKKNTHRKSICVCENVRNCTCDPLQLGEQFKREFLTGLTSASDIQSGFSEKWSNITMDGGSLEIAELDKKVDRIEALLQALKEQAHEDVVKLRASETTSQNNSENEELRNQSMHIDDLISQVSVLNDELKDMKKMVKETQTQIDTRIQQTPETANKSEEIEQIKSLLNTMMTQNETQGTKAANLDRKDEFERVQNLLTKVNSHFEKKDTNEEAEKIKELLAKLRADIQTQSEKNDTQKIMNLLSEINSQFDRQSQGGMEKESFSKLSKLLAKINNQFEAHVEKNDSEKMMNLLLKIQTQFEKQSQGGGDKEQFQKILKTLNKMNSQFEAQTEKNDPEKVMSVLTKMSAQLDRQLLSPAERDSLQKMSKLLSKVNTQIEAQSQKNESEKIINLLTRINTQFENGVEKENFQKMIKSLTRITTQLDAHAENNLVSEKILNLLTKIDTQLETKQNEEVNNMLAKLDKHLDANQSEKMMELLTKMNAQLGRHQSEKMVNLLTRIDTQDKTQFEKIINLLAKIDTHDTTQSETIIKILSRIDSQEKNQADKMNNLMKKIDNSLSKNQSEHMMKLLSKIDTQLTAKSNNINNNNNNNSNNNSNNNGNVAMIDSADRMERSLLSVSEQLRSMSMLVKRVSTDQQLTVDTFNEFLHIFKPIVSKEFQHQPSSSPEFENSVDYRFECISEQLRKLSILMNRTLSVYQPQCLLNKLGEVEKYLGALHFKIDRINETKPATTISSIKKVGETHHREELKTPK